jgi:hypothetical protein
MSYPWRPRPEDTMPSAVKLSDEIVAVARKEASVMKRSIAGQVEYWAELGRRVEAAGLVDYASVRAVLEGRGSLQQLTPAETTLYLELLVGFRRPGTQSRARMRKASWS